MIDSRPRERWHKKESIIDNDKCPKCREVSKEPVMPFGGDSFFCTNPICLITRFNDNGYYLESNESITTPDVEYIVEGMKKKRPQKSKPIIKQ